MTITKAELMTPFCPPRRVDRAEKDNLAERLARDREAYLQAGGQVRQVPVGMTGAEEQEWGREALGEPVDADEFAAMIGATGRAVITASQNKRLWGHSFPEAVRIEGRRQWTLSAALNFRAKVLRGKAA